MAERNCPRCTLFNPADATNCAACDMKLPPAPAAAAPLSPAGRRGLLGLRRRAGGGARRRDRRAAAGRPPPADDGWASFESAPVAVPPPPTFDTAPETAARDVGSFDAGFGADFSAFESAPAGAVDEGPQPSMRGATPARRTKASPTSGPSRARRASRRRGGGPLRGLRRAAEPGEPEPVPGPDEDPGFAAFDVDEAPLAAPGGDAAPPAEADDGFAAFDQAPPAAPADAPAAPTEADDGFAAFDALAPPSRRRRPR